MKAEFYKPIINFNGTENENGTDFLESFICKNLLKGASVSLDSCDFQKLLNPNVASTLSFQLFFSLRCRSRQLNRRYAIYGKKGFLKATVITDSQWPVSGVET